MINLLFLPLYVAIPIFIINFFNTNISLLDYKLFYILVPLDIDANFLLNFFHWTHVYILSIWQSSFLQLKILYNDIIREAASCE